MPENNNNNNNNNKENKDHRYEAFGYEDEEELNKSQIYSRRMLQKHQLERKMRRGNRLITRLHFLLRFVIIIGLIYLLYITLKAPFWYFDKDLFTKPGANLEIINNNVLSTYKIMDELKKFRTIKQPLYKFETDIIKSELEKFEIVDEVYIRKYLFPARLQIIVKERVPLLLIYTSENAPPEAFFTEDGVLVGKQYLPLPNEIKTIKIITNNSYKDWDKTKIDEIKKLANYVEQASNEKIQYIDLRNQKDVYIKINSTLLRAGVFDETITERVSRIASILPKLKNLDKTVQYVDLRWRNTSYIKINSSTAPKTTTEQSKQIKEDGENEEDTNKQEEEISEQQKTDPTSKQKNLN